MTAIYRQQSVIKGPMMNVNSTSATSAVNAVSRTYQSSATSGSSESGEAKQSTKKLDFTNMTRKELFDATNAMLKSGEITVKESIEFITMTARINIYNPSAGIDDIERVDFIAKSKDYLAFAQSQNDSTNEASILRAMELMKKLQGKTIGITATA